jgi:hypothetical protein
MSCYVIQLPNSLSHPGKKKKNKKKNKKEQKKRWVSPGTPASFTTKTGRHDTTEILLKVTLKHQQSKINFFLPFFLFC